MKQNKHIVVIETPPWATRRIQVTDLMSLEELEEAKRERPDLIFTLAKDLPEKEPVSEPVSDKSDKPSRFSLENPKGYSIHGMVMPHNLEDIVKDLEE